MAYHNSFDPLKAALGQNPYDITVNPVLWKKSQALVDKINELKLVMKLQEDPMSWYSSLRQRKADPLFQLSGEKTFDDVYKEYLKCSPFISVETARDLTLEAMARQDNEFDKLLKKHKKVKQEDIDRLMDILQQRSASVNATQIKSVPLFEDNDLIFEKKDFPNCQAEFVTAPGVIDFPEPGKTICLNPLLKYKNDILTMYTPVLDVDSEYLPRIPDKTDINDPIFKDFTSDVLREAITGPKRNLVYLLLFNDSKIGEVGSVLYKMMVIIGLEHGYKTGKMPTELFSHCNSVGMVPQIVMGSGLQEVIDETEQAITQTVTEEID